MREEPFSGSGPGGEEPEGPAPLPDTGNGPQDNPEPASEPAGSASDASASDASASDASASDASASDASASDGPPPDDGWDEAPPEEPGEQGLFVCLPPQQMDLSGFGGDGGTPPMAPGPLLAGVTYAVAGGDGAGLGQASEDYLYAVMSAGRRMSSWGTWLELAAMRELAVRHPAPDPPARKNRPAAPGNSPAQDPRAAQDHPGSQDHPASQDRPAAPKSAGAASQDPAGPGARTAGTPADRGKPAADGRIQFSEFISDEVACELRLTWMAAADRMSYACDLAGRLPVTFAALGAGLIDPVHAKIIYEQTDILSAADAAKADPELAAAAQTKTYGELRAAAAKLVLKLDPDAHERRKQANRREAHVRPFREESGNAGMVARELPSDEVLASWQHVEQRALDLRAAGVPGSLRELRIRAYLDLLQERDSRLAAGPAQRQGGPGDDDGPQDGPSGSGGSGPRPHGPGGTGPDGRARPDAKDPGPCLAALVNITVPLATALGQSGIPGEAGGFGLLDAGTARDLLAAAGRSPHTRWCVTVLYPDGTAAAHGCAVGRHPPPPGPEPPGPEPPGSRSPGSASSAAPPPPGPAPPGTANLGTSCDTSGSPDQRPPADTGAQDYLLSLGVRLALIARGNCDHRHAETGYQPSRKLQHLIRTRSTRCTAPGCGRPAARCDLDHTLAWDKGGLTCECGLAPLCRHHHRCKQAQGWQLTQPEPGVLVFRTPHGRTFTTTPTVHPV
jgi:Domain of unknown function (DUF222)